MGKGVLTLAVLALAGAASASEVGEDFDGGRPAPKVTVQFHPSPRPAAPDALEIPLTLHPQGGHLGQASVPCSFDASPQGQCLLDTGAGVDVVFGGASWSDALPVVKPGTITGACDQNALRADVVSVRDFKVGGTSLGARTFQRLDRDHANREHYLGIVGAETLTSASRFSLRFTRSPALILGPQGSAAGGGFAVTSEDQIVLPIPVGSASLPALFDTGSNSSIVDLSYAQGHPNDFRLVAEKEVQAGCATGSKRKIAFYETTSLRIGNVLFPTIPLIAFDFSALRKTVERDDVQIILGYDVISQLDWTFDWKAKTWATSSGITIQTAENFSPSFPGIGETADSALWSVYAR